MRGFASMRHIRFGHFSVDEYLKRTYRFNVTKEGYLTKPVVFAEHGETNVAVGKTFIIPDGEIYVYDAEGI